MQHDRRIAVSTHSRPKAADQPDRDSGQRDGFNTQPPEGGWSAIQKHRLHRRSFNTQPPEGGWSRPLSRLLPAHVSTHSRPKAAEPLLKALFHQVSQP